LDVNWVCVGSGSSVTGFVFSLLVWVYVVVIQVTHPSWLRGPFSHIPVFPFNWRVDDVGITAFAVAAVSFLLWQMQLDKKHK